MRSFPAFQAGRRCLIGEDLFAAFRINDGNALIIGFGDNGKQPPALIESQSVRDDVVQESRDLIVLVDLGQPFRAGFRKDDAAIRKRNRTFRGVEVAADRLDFCSAPDDPKNVWSDGVRCRRFRRSLRCGALAEQCPQKKTKSDD